MILSIKGTIGHQEKRFCYIADNMRATAIIAYIVLYSESHTLYSKYSAI